MESGETNDIQTYAGHQRPNSWNSIGSPPPDIQPKSSDGQIPVYFNAPDNQASNAASPYPQPQKSPAMQLNTLSNSAGQAYSDQFRYHQHAPSPGPGRINHRMTGHYPGSTAWNNNNPAPPQHPPYMSPDRGRYNTRPPYPNYDPSKFYPNTAQPGNPPQGSWPRAPYPSPHPAYNDQSRIPRYGQADVAGPVVPAGLQALQANNNNATLMQHQHTPMLVPNPHYNQNRAQQGAQIIDNKADPAKPELQTPQRPMGPTHENNLYSPAPTNPPTPNYYSAHSPHPQQHPGVGPMHHQVGLSSPSVSPYPVNPATPGSVKSKARGNKCYQCPKCVKVFRRGDHLKRHLLSVHDHEHPYQCGECGKGFASVPTLLKHAKSLHVGALAKGLMCLRCQMTFGTFQEIETHAHTLHVQEDEIYMQNINTSSKQHCCNACTKSFSSAANLKRHMQLLHRSKDDSKLFCRECGKSFTRVDGLRKHVDKVHSGNPNAMPPADELEDAETLSQAHSSESESRGPSADTDESSLPAQPANSHWASYTTPTPITADQRPGTHGLGQPLTAPPPLPAFQPQHQTTAPASQENVPAGRQHTPALQSSPPNSSPLPTPKLPPHQNSNTDIQALQPQAKNPQTTNGSAAPTSHGLLGTVVSHAGPVTIPTDVTSAGKIEPKSVSEALSMAMKALSDFDYETPGFEMYPFPHVTPALPQPVQQNRTYMHQHQTFVPQLRNGIPSGVNQRYLGVGPPPSVPPYSSNQDFSRHGDNFLMTVPPPPGSMTAARPSPQHVTAGALEAPQLSRLLQEGGGGVKSPTVINDNNNCNVNNDSPPPRFDTPEIPQNGSRRRRKADAEDDAAFLTEQDQIAEKVDLSCTICMIEYDSIDSLMGHIEGVHLKKNPHECCICKKHFAQAGNVKRHIRFVHLRERPFRCKDCSCTFDRLCYLQRHMRTHLQLSEENQEFNPLKPCSCPECGKRCLTAHHLRGHMQRKHFAKNKQNYAQFLAKYGHLEALGTGPGAITSQQKGRKGRKKKLSEDDYNSDINGLPKPKSYGPGTLHNSSPMPISSSEHKALSNMPHYQYAPPQSIPPVMQFQTPTYTPPPQSNVGYNTRMQVETVYSNCPDQPAPRASVSGFLSRMPMVELQQQQFEIPYFGANSTATLNGGQVYSGVQVSQTGEVAMENAFAMMSREVAQKTTTKTKVRKHARRFVRKRRKLLRYRCTRCVLRSFASLAMLKSHLSLIHKTSLKRHVCVPCGKSFARRSALECHRSKIHKRKGRQNKVKDNAPPKLIHTSNTPQTVSGTPAQQMAPLAYPQNVAYCLPTQQPYYGYDPNSPAMVPSPNVQTAYAPPTHQLTAQMPLIQT